LPEGSSKTGAPFVFEDTCRNPTSRAAHPRGPLFLAHQPPLLPLELLNQVEDLLVDLAGHWHS
jgi:hypothetical protein